jgi:hypothetical protein
MNVTRLFFALAVLNLGVWALFTYAPLSPFRGDYSSEGSLVLSNGLSKDIKITTSVNDDEVYEVINVEGFYMEFYRKIYTRQGKDYRFFNMSDGADLIKEHLYGDDRLVFNYLYSVRKGSHLTVKNILDDDFGACFYIIELKKVRCITR